MRRICIYWMAVLLFAQPAMANGIATDIVLKATETREDRLERRVATLEKLAEYMARQKFPQAKAEPKPKDVPPPKLSKPVVTYRTETRYRSVPYTVKMCQNGRCWFETRYYQQAYTVQVPVASSQYVEPEAASTPMAEVKRMADLVALPQGSTVLDPGAGRDARVAIELARRGYRVLAFEIDGGRYRSAKQAIESSGYGDRIRLVHGDVTKYEFDCDGVVAYMYPNVLDSIAKRLKKSKRLRKFISYQHDVESLSMVRSGDIYVWTKPVPQATFSFQQPSVPRRYAVWNGQIYHGDYNPNCACEMCRSIRAQQGIPGR